MNFFDVWIYGLTVNFACFYTHFRPFATINIMFVFLEIFAYSGMRLYQYKEDDFRFKFFDFY